MPGPSLTGPALDAVRHRGSHVQIIAAAGSGKTEVVSQRVADLLAEGQVAESIVAFTFTERAAYELKNRIAHRVEDRLGTTGLDRLAGLFVGTIHGFCFRLLQQKVPRYETYDVLDDNQLTAFLSREATRLELRQLDSSNRLFASIAAFLQSMDVVENELLDPESLPDPFGAVLRNYYGTLDRYRLLTYGQQIVRALRELERAELAAEVHGRLRHLIVDEYQDINPAQERLIELLTDLTTIHRAKGLEWPAVFVPSVTANRFPTTRTGEVQGWLVPRDRFDAPRYEGSDADERRLFYVAITRARDWLSVSRHGRINTRTVSASPYYQELAHLEVRPEDIVLPVIEIDQGGVDDPISITYSDLAGFIECGYAFRLRDLIGFQPRLAPELGYGKAVHHVMRAIAETTKASGQVPTPREIDEVLDASFFLPTANKPAHRQLKDAARRLVTTYAEKHEADLYRVWETERPFELHLAGVTVTGRADVILDQEGGVPTSLAIVDYKTSTSGEVHDHALQLQIYADAGRREGLDVRGAYVHDLKEASRNPVDVTPAAIVKAEANVTAAVARIRARDYRPNPGLRCRRCEVRTICASAKR